MVEECEYKKDHPEIEAQLHSLGSALTRLEDEVVKLRDGRMEDFNKMIDKLGEVHEKVNTVANVTSNITGKIAVYGLLASAAGGAIVFLATQLFTHVAKQ